MVGNTMIDSLFRLLPHRAEGQPARRLSASIGAATCSSRCTGRRSSTSPERLLPTVDVLARHRHAHACRASAPSRAPGSRLDEAGVSLPDGILALDPLGYLEFIALEAESRLVITDSGGVQEETTALGIPCLTFRDTTERPITTTLGTNRLVGLDPGRLRAMALAELDGAILDEHCARRYRSGTAAQVYAPVSI